MCRLLILSPVFWLSATALLAMADTSLWPHGILGAAAYRRGLVGLGFVIVIAGFWRGTRRGGQ
jgi:hypothetical protein